MKSNKKMFTLLSLIVPLCLQAQEQTDSVKNKDLQTLEIRQRNNGNTMDALNPIRTEKITQLELKKNACCNLAESFETNPTVEVSFSNALTGARQIQMLGLSGVYVQMMTDLLPTVRGLNYTYGFSNIPGPQVNAIFINKGPGSVTNGFESMTGQIDVELQKPEKSPRFFINAYLNSRLRQEINTNYSHRFNERWSTLLMAHASQIQNKVDMNNDSYLDRPLYKQINLINRWKYAGKRVETMFGIKGLYDDKQGGQIEFDPKKPQAAQSAYGFGMTTRRWEIFNKTSFNFDEEGDRSLGIQSNFTSHDIQSYYGLNPYLGNQKTLFLNLLYQTYVRKESNTLRVGGGLLYDDIAESYKYIRLSRQEPVAGLFAEYTMVGSEKWSVLLGARSDYNFRLQRWYFIPRTNVKYSLNKSMSIRGSAGSGFRTANIFAENAQMLASNRVIHLIENLMPEYSWNYGLNYTWTFTQHQKEGRFSVDVFRTDFVNQVVADFDVTPQSVYFYNLKGKSNAWYVQAELYREISKDLDIRLAYKFNDVRITQHGILMEKALNARHRALVNLAYQTKNQHWKFDFTTQWVGKQRLPNLSTNPEMYQLRAWSPSYFRLLCQITYVYKKFEVYMGSENLNNFTQKQVVVDGAHPFGEYFDAGNIWGPTLGRMIYVGCRYSIK